MLMVTNCKLILLPIISHWHNHTSNQQFICNYIKNQWVCLAEWYEPTFMTSATLFIVKCYHGEFCGKENIHLPAFQIFWSKSTFSYEILYFIRFNIIFINISPRYSWALLMIIFVSVVDNRCLLWKVTSNVLAVVVIRFWD